jgi:DNA topoisomerase-1
MKPLIIVESYTKTKTISKYLDNKYDVICSLGHINNLPVNELGIDTVTWKGKYIDTNSKIIANIRKHAKDASCIYIASDPDMEGEAIAMHIYNAIKSLISVPVHRIRFHEITKRAITESLTNPEEINQDIVDAQESRRFVDRLVGYKLSPILWNNLSDNTLSVGRVQSVALLMCIKMLSKIQANEATPYWVLIATFAPNNIEFKLHNSSNDVFKTTDKQLLYSILQHCTFDKNYSMTFTESVSHESPSAPYTTTSMQQDAYNKLRFSSKKTMLLAQQLYENGLITYMRTDSTHISDAFKKNILSYVNEKYGANYAKFRSYKNKIANAQEAHEAIRITNVNANIPSCNLSGDHNRLYDMIWKRTIACQMVNAEYLNISVSLKYPGIDYTFIHKKPILMSQGYLIVYGIQIDTSPDEFNTSMSSMKIKDFQCKGSIDTPPSLYNEIQLIKALEKEGIGRPSTYASIVDKLLSKKYVCKGQNPQQDIPIKHIIKTKTGIQELADKIAVGGKQKDLLVPTELGIKIITYLETIVPFLLDIHFTATMEDSLDKICQKEMSKKQLLDGFYNDYLAPVVKMNEHTTIVSSKPAKTFASGIVKTKYGYCYYHASTKKYTNIESYLKWKNIAVEGLQEKDIKFLKSLPKKLEDGTELHIGQYGLYIKNKNKNCKLDKSKWESYI